MNTKQGRSKRKTAREAGATPAIVVPYVDFPAQFRQTRDQILSAVERTLLKGDLILGGEVETFEQEFAKLCGVKHAVGVGSGTDALILALKALKVGPGDEVITAPNSWISTASSIVAVGARPVFVDVGEDLNMDPRLIGAAVTPRTRAILPVHLTGRCAEMTAILEIAERHRLHVIEDAAQSVGAMRHGRRAGSFGTAGCFSLHPLKNLNAAGDAGIITTDDDRLAATLRLLRNHGLRTRDDVAIWGYNSRLDAIQAAILRFRLSILTEVTEARRRHARRYRAALSPVAPSVVQCPTESADDYHVYHLFVIQCDRRDELQAFLASRGIDTRVHYPTPIHLQACSRDLGYHPGDFPVTERQARRMLSLPIHHCLGDAQVDMVGEAIRAFYAGGASRR